MKEVMDDLGIDVDPDALGDLVKDGKKEEEKKDGKEKKDK